MLDGCFDFVLAFPSTIVSRILAHLRPDRSSLVLDPFCGTGTTLLECKRQAIPAVGIDANPVCVLAARAKTNWQVTRSEVSEVLTKVLDEADVEYLRFRTAARHKRKLGGYLHPTSWEVFRATRQGRYLLDSGLLERRWISATPALKALLVVRAIEATKSLDVREFLLVALLGLLVTEFSNLKYGPELYCNRIRRDADVFGVFRQRVSEILDSLDAVRDRPTASCSIVQGNSMKEGLGEALEPESVTHVVTSPPYPAEHDYTRMTRLELAFGGFVTSDLDLRAIKRQMIPCSSKSSYADQKYYDSVRRFASVRNLRAEILKRSRLKTHGFARVYPRLVGDYFGGMYQHFKALETYLVPGARCAYVVGDQSSFFGVHIQTSLIIRRMLASRSSGYEFERCEIYRNRRGNAGAKRTIPEVIVYFRKR